MTIRPHIQQQIDRLRGVQLSHEEAQAFRQQLAFCDRNQSAFDNGSSDRIFSRADIERAFGTTVAQPVLRANSIRYSPIPESSHGSWMPAPGLTARGGWCAPSEALVSLGVNEPLTEPGEIESLRRRANATMGAIRPGRSGQVITFGADGRAEWRDA